MKKPRFGIFLILLIKTSLLLTAESQPPLRFLYMVQSGYRPEEVMERAQEFTEQTGTPVLIELVEYDDLYSTVTAVDANYDVILLDLIWTAEFAEQQLIEPLPDRLKEEISTGMIPSVQQTFAYSNQFWGYPFLADFQLFYYNRRILNLAGISQPPRNLDQLKEAAVTIKNQGIVTYPWFDSFASLEALVCEFVWLTGAFGGSLEVNGRIKVNSAASLAALSYLKELLDEGLINPYSLQADELLSAEVFLKEDCAFTTNWTFLSGLIVNTSDPIKDYAFPALIPSETEQSSSINGFIGLAVMKSSSNKNKAWELIQFMASPEFQRRNLNEMSVWTKVWKEPQTTLEDPWIDIKSRQIPGLKNRPRHRDYTQISEIIQFWLTKILSEEILPEQGLNNAQQEIEGHIYGSN